MIDLAAIEVARQRIAPLHSQNAHTALYAAERG
jgi:hypothetical protein